MKTTIKTFVKKISFTLLVAAAFVLPSCRIGLGEALDLKGPSVEITSPESRENVKDKFTISGIVTDDFEIGTVTVKITYDKEFKGEWKNENASWKHRATAGGDYSSYGNATWEVSADRRSVKWTINDVNPTGAGVFKITVSAVDATGNASEESTKSRDVIIDGTPPLIEIAKPKLSLDKSTFDVPDYKDITKINMFMTGDFTITGYAKDDNTIKFVDLRLIGADDGKEYFAKRLDIDADPTIDSLRAWDIDVVLNDCALGALDSTRHVLSVYTNTADAAGNTNNDLVFQGYTCLWRDADIPWIAMSEFKGTTAAVPKQVYSGSPLQGTAYDDTAVSKVTVTMKRVDKAGVVGNVVAGFNDKILYEVKEGAEDDNNIPFDLITPEDCEKFYVELRAFDNKGNVSETTAGYIKVEDKTYPAIDIAYSDGHNANIKADENGKDEKGVEVFPKQKSSGDTLFGDSAGNFTFNIRAFDDTMVTSIKMVYIPNDKAEKVIDYSSSNYEGWTTTKDDIAATDIAFKDTEKTDNSIGIIRKVYSAYRQMNLFGNGTGNTLGINGNTKKLENQTFVFRIEDNNGNAMTKTVIIQGDVDAPTIEFTGIEYYADGKNKTTIDLSKGLPAFGLDTKVKVFGKISDNSATPWGGFSRLKLELNANDVSITPSISPDGTFVATASNLRGASLIFDGTLTDYAGNSAKEKYTFLVDTQNVKIEYISSTSPDGNYNLTTTNTIDIYIRLNMLVKVTGTPKLTLNSGATVSMTAISSETGANELHFSYTTANTNNETKKLNVTGFDLTGCTIKNYKDVVVTNEVSKQLGELVKGDNLASVKSICLIKGAPALQNKSSLAFGSDGKLKLTYDKDVARGKGNITITQKTVDKVPPLMSPSKYRTLVAKAPGLAKYYEEITDASGTNYVLKYANNSSDTEIVNLYKGTNYHILKQNIMSGKVTISGKTVTIDFGNSLPCKGVAYELKIDAGFVQDSVGGSAFPSAAETIDNWLPSKEIEKPVIRIDRTTTTVDTSYNATQPLKTHFKIDCQTSVVSLNYSYTLKKWSAKEVVPKDYQHGPNAQVLNGSESNGASGNGSYDSTPIEIGDNDYKSGLVYNITATASKTGLTTATTTTNAYRTVIQINDFKIKVDRDAVKTDYNYIGQGYLKSVWKGNNSDSIRRLFIRGGDNELGANSTSGLPTDWDENHTQKVCMMTNDGNNYYFATWNINVQKYYFMFLVGLCDNKTISANGENGISEGPQYFCYAQNCWVGEFKRYPISAGQYIIVYDKVNKNGDQTNVEFLVNDAGKPVQVR